MELLTFVKPKLHACGEGGPGSGAVFPTRSSALCAGRSERSERSSARRTAERGSSCRVALLRVLVRIARAHQIPVLPHPIAVTANVDDVAIVWQPVDERRRHHLVAQHADAGSDLTPSARVAASGRGRSCSGSPSRCRQGHTLLSSSWPIMTFRCWVAAFVSSLRTSRAGTSTRAVACDVIPCKQGREPGNGRKRNHRSGRCLIPSVNRRDGRSLQASSTAARSRLGAGRVRVHRQVNCTDFSTPVPCISHVSVTRPL